MKKTEPTPDAVLDLALRFLPPAKVALPDQATVHRYLQGALSPAEAEQVRAAAASSDAFRARLLNSMREQHKKKHKAAATGLPVETRPFVGREKELVKLKGLVRGNRLVTVVGAGGLGKSRLARQCALELSEEMDVVYVDASGIASEEDLQCALAGHPLEGKLLLLDDLKAPFNLQKLLYDQYDLYVLTTARHPLGLPKEKAFNLDPMQADALAFFAAAARRIVKDFQVTAQNQALVQSLCKRLMGVPLSLSLAAGCLAQQSVPELLQSLEAPRQTATQEEEQPFLKTLDHSILLLSQSDRQNLRMLAAFDGAFTPEDASFVLGADAAPILEMLERKGLLEGQNEGYRLHDDVAQHLAATPQAQEKHAILFSEKAQQVGQSIKEGRWEKGIRELFANNANFRRATQTAIAKDDHALIAKLAKGLARSYLEAGYLADYRTLSEAATRSAEQTHDAALTIALLGMQGALAAREGDASRATRLWQTRAELARETGDRFAYADSITDLALQAFDHDDLPLAIGYLDEAQTLSQRAGSWELVATAQIIRARLYAKLGQSDKALRWIAEARESMAKGENRELLLFVRQSIALAYQLLDMPAETLEAIQALLAEAAEGHRAVLTGWSLRNLAPLLEERGDLEAALKAHLASVAVHNEYATKHRERSQQAFEEFQNRHREALQSVLPSLSDTPWEELIRDLLTDR